MDFIEENKHYSEFNIMCTYVYHLHRDSYRWYVHNTNPDWNGKDNPTPVKGLAFDVFSKQFTPQMLLPKPRVAVHARCVNKNCTNQQSQCVIMWYAGIMFSTPSTRFTRISSCMVSCCNAAYARVRLIRRKMPTSRSFVTNGR
jgi:hypothetical protein